MQAAWSTAFETALIGGRGSSKTESLLYFLMKGWPNADTKLATTYTYLNSPNYSFLVLRKNAKDLADFASAPESSSVIWAEISPRPV